jgi:TMEM175 potassium channel family protein
MTDSGTGGGESEAPGGRPAPGGRRAVSAWPLARSGFLEYDRVLFFSDAVFAIAITLLAFDLPKRGLHHAAPRLYSFGISFAVIGLFWLGHHAIFRYITALDRRLIMINLLFLGFIALLPYPTRLLGRPGGTPHAAPVVFYAACCAAAGLCEAAIWLYATRPGSGLADPSAAAARRHFALRIARVPVVFLISIPIAFVTPENTPYIWILIVVAGVVINRFSPLPDTPEPVGQEIRG